MLFTNVAELEQFLENMLKNTCQARTCERQTCITRLIYIFQVLGFGLWNVPVSSFQVVVC